MTMTASGRFGRIGFVVALLAGTLTLPGLTPAVPAAAEGEPSHVWDAGADLAASVAGSAPTANPFPDAYGNTAAWRLARSAFAANAARTTLGLSTPCDPKFREWGSNGVTGTISDTSFTGQFCGPTQTWVANELHLHPSSSGEAGVVEWTSPFGADVEVTVTITDRDAACGDGIAWMVTHGTTALASGTVGNGGSVAVNVDHAALDSVTVAARDTIAVVVGPGGSFNCDHTQVDFTITTLAGVTSAAADIPGTANLFVAGQASSSDGTVPPFVEIPAGTTSVRIAPTTGTVAFIADGTNYGPEGSTTPTNLDSTNGISGLLADRGEFLAGVFLGDGAPTVAPDRLDFRASGFGTGWPGLSPQLAQSFFVGDGLDEFGFQQEFSVPEGATRLFLGFGDGTLLTGPPAWYNDNSGQLQTTVHFDSDGTGTPEAPSSTFDDDADGWGVIGDPTTPDPVHVVEGDNGFIRVTDGAAGLDMYWVAPEKFLGDRSDYVGGTLEFDLRQAGSGSQYDATDVILEGGGHTLHFDTASNPGTTFTPYEIELAEGAGWTDGGEPVAADVLAEVLGDVTALHIRAEYQDGPDVGDLDNVTLVAPATEPPSIWDLGTDATASVESDTPAANPFADQYGGTPWRYGAQEPAVGSPLIPMEDNGGIVCAHPLVSWDVDSGASAGINVHETFVASSPCANGQHWVADKVMVHPSNGSQAAVVEWTSPFTGTIAIEGGVTDRDHGGGSGIAWRVDAGADTDFATIAGGSFGNGGSQLFSAGDGGDALADIDVDEGESIRVVVLNNGDFFYDLTQVDLTITRTDVPEAATGSIFAVVVNDENGNGYPDAGEEAIPGFPITVTKGATTHTVTTDDGTHTFTDLAVGDWTVSHGPLDGWTTTTEPKTATVLDQLESTVVVHLAQVTPEEPTTGSIFALVIHDQDGDGVVDQNEPPIPGYPITISKGEDVQTVTTDDGMHTFTDLEPGDWTVDTGTLGGWMTTTMPKTVTVTAAYASETVVLLARPAGSIFALVIHDQDGDGVVDQNEPPIPGYPITITKGSVTETVTTDDGMHTFTRLEPGDWTVSTGTLAGWETTSAPKTATVIAQLESTVVVLLAERTSYDVDVEVSGPGTVTGSDVSCSTYCTTAVDHGDSLTITANPSPGAIFTGWSGACSAFGSNRTCTLTPTGNLWTTATFQAVPRALSIATVTSATGVTIGSGRVTSTPAGIDCGTDCHQTYSATTSVTLTFVPAPGSKLGTVQGCSVFTALGGAPRCTVSVSGLHTVTVRFDSHPQVHFSAGPNSTMGTVTVTSASTSCGIGCAVAPAGQTVKFSAAPTAGHKLLGWTGCTPSGSTCSLVMPASGATVKANFGTAGRTEVTVKPSTGGTVEFLDANPPSQACAAVPTVGTCRSFAENATIQVIASPAPGYQVAAGGTGCTWTAVGGSVNPICTKTVSGAELSIQALFTPKPKSIEVDIVGPGSIGVAGLVCNSPGCTLTGYPTGHTIDLFVFATGAGHQFSHWTGCDELRPNNVCRMVLDEDESVVATFAVAQPNRSVTLSLSAPDLTPNSQTGLWPTTNLTVNVKNPGTSTAPATTVDVVLPEFVSFAGTSTCTVIDSHRIRCAVPELTPGAGMGRTLPVQPWFWALSGAPHVLRAELPADGSSADNNASINLLARQTANTVYVKVTDSVLESVPWMVPGQTVHWAFDTLGTRSIVDTTLLGNNETPLYASPSISGFGAYRLTFHQAGRWTYREPAGARTGGLDIGLVSGTRIGTSVQIRWGNANIPATTSIVVNCEKSTGPVNGAVWTQWIDASKAQSATLSGVRGQNNVRCRVRDYVTGSTTGWSPVLSITL